MIQAANPLIKGGTVRGGSIMDLKGTINIIEQKTAEGGKKAAEAKLGDLSWAEGLF